MNPVILTSAYLAPVQYYAKLASAPYVIEERHDHYVKQTYRNRCIIAGPGGRLPLTVPVERTPGEGKACTGEMRISEHGNWRHLHWTALVSAYERSPYFEYYADAFRPFYAERTHDLLADFNAALRDTVLSLLGISPQITIAPSYVDADKAAADDWRETIRPKISFEADTSFRAIPYYQVFSAANGFLPNLSILDLLFNMGPAARLYLQNR